MRRFILSLGLSVTALVLSACGGGGGGSSDASSGGGGAVTSSSITLPSSVQVVSAH